MQTKNSKSNNYLMLIEYNGSKYSGWQKQPGLDTIEQRFRDALSPVFGNDIKLIVSGRTDAGVHALKQFCNFKSDLYIKPSKVMALLHGRLPKDIAIIKVSLVGNSFDSRYSAKSKTYEYLIWNGHGRSVWNKHYWHIAKPLDLKAMKKAAAVLVGKHDFSAFEAPRSSMRSKIVNLQELRLKKHSSRVRIEFTADRFLYKMVRNIAGTLVEIGLGRMSSEKMGEILKSKCRHEAGPTAPPDGLFLKNVKYS